MMQIENQEHKKQWFEGFTFIFNMHWNKVDNYRIDKYLSFLRFMFGQSLQFLKDNQYSKNKELITWYQDMLLKILLDSQDTAITTAQGIPLQICDIFLKEMNKVDADLCLDDLAAIIDPFLKALGKIHSGELKERIIN